MFKWIKNFLEKLLNKNIKMIEAPIANPIQSTKPEKEDQFLLNLKRHANSEACDGNGYNIIPKIKLKDML